MALNRLGVASLFCIIAVLHGGQFCFTDAADIDFLFDLVDNVSGIAETFPEWNRGNVTNKAGWKGVTFDANDRITRLFLTGALCCNEPARTYNWTGVWPQSFQTLTALREFRLTYTSGLTGNFSFDVFQLFPNIIIFDVEGEGFSMRLPQRWPSRLRIFAFSRGTFQSPTFPIRLPEIDSGSSNLEQLYCDACALACPLPAWLVDSIVADRLRVNCLLRGNYLNITNGMICGQIPADDTNCNLLPTVSKPLPKSYFLSNTPSYVMENQNAIAEVYGSAVYVFSKYVSKRTNQTLIYRDEYTAYVFKPFFQVAKADGQVGTRLFTVPTFSNFIKISDSEFHVNVTYGAGQLSMLYKFSFKNGDFVAFDIISNSIVGQREVFGDYLGVNQEYIFRMQHSNMDPMSCARSSLLTAFYSGCSSDILTSELRLIFPDGDFFVGYSNSRVRAELRLPTGVLIDGRTPTDYFVDVPVFAEPYGNVDAIERYKKSFPNSYFATRQSVSPEEQYISVLASFYFPLWNSSFVYDPDIRIDLLFDPPDPPGAAPTVVDAVQNGVVIGVVVTVVVVVLVAGSVAVVVKVIFPYRAAQKAKASQVPIPESDDGDSQAPQNDRSNRWSSAHAPQSVRNT